MLSARSFAPRTTSLSLWFRNLSDFFKEDSPDYWFDRLHSDICYVITPPPPCLETKDESMYNSITLLPDVQLLTWLKYIAEKLTKVQSDHGDYLILKHRSPDVRMRCKNSS